LCGIGNVEKVGAREKPVIKGGTGGPRQSHTMIKLGDETEGVKKPLWEGRETCHMLLFKVGGGKNEEG